MATPAAARVDRLPGPPFRPHLGTQPWRIGAENRRNGDSGWLAPDGVNHALEAYASELSVPPGGVLHLHVSTAPAAWYLIKIYRLGWYGGSGARLVACMPSDCVATEQGQPQPLPSP